MGSRQVSILLALALVWGGSFLFIKVLIDDGVAPLGISAGRTALGALSLLPFAIRGRRGLIQTRRTWAGLGFLGLLNFAIPWTLFGIAEQHAPSGAASIANSTTPLWSALLAAAVLHSDRVTGARAFGLAVGFAGVLVLAGGDLVDVRSDGFVAVLLILLATLCYAASAVSIRRWFRHVAPIPLASAQVSFAALYLAPLALFSGAYSGSHFDTGTWLSLVALGVVGSGVAVVGYMTLIQQVGAVRASVVTYLIPPIGVFLGWLVLDESLGWNLLAGLAAVVAGVALVQGLWPGAAVVRAWRRSPSAAEPAPVSGD